MLHRLIKGLLRVAFRLYYRTIDVQGLDRLPAQGPVLLVANHPNTLIDPAILVRVLPRPIAFGAKHTLFSNALLRPILEAFGAIPLVRASDDPKNMGKNLEAFDRYHDLLQSDRVAAIFPEGRSHDEPQIAPMKTGAARIALRAEASRDFELGLTILPVGLQFHPRRSFRAEALVRIGEPVRAKDLAGLHARAPREAVRELTDRIGVAIKGLALHLEDPEKAPLAERITAVYWRRIQATGLGPWQSKALRGELLQRISDALNHFQKEAPEKVADIESSLRRYDRLRKAAGIDRRLLEEPARLLPGVLGALQAFAEAIVGALPALVGFLTGAIPYYVTRAYARRSTGRDRPVGVSLAHLLAGALAFPLFYGGLIAMVAWRFSDQATVLVAVLLIPLGLFARAYLRRMRSIVAHIGSRTASLFKLEAVTRVRQERDVLVRRLDELRNRYRVEVLEWEPLPSLARRESKGPAVVRVLAMLVVGVTLGLFIWGYRDRPVNGLRLGPSPWQTTRGTNSALAERELLRDAHGVLLAAEQLDRLQGEMRVLQRDFREGDRSFLSQQDYDEIHVLLLAYLDLRTALLKTIWLYRGENSEASIASADPLEARAFLTAFTAAAVLVEKAWLIYDAFRDDARTRRALDSGDEAWSIPPGAFSDIVASLSNQSVMAELQAALQRFEIDREAGRFPHQAPWADLAARAEAARPTLDRALDGVGRRRLRRTLREMAEQIRNPVGEIKPVISMWVSRFRIKERPPHRGLISEEQLETLRAELQPGDILIERRNWYMTNCFLPGFWPHAAIYMGTYEQLQDLGVIEDPRASKHMSDFRKQDELGRNFAVLEAIGEGVIFTSLEHSVGEADAVVALRPILSREALREALLRALSHRGKEYDFDFDFETTDTLVCTELVFRAYDGILKMPEMELIMGKPRLPASGYVRMWAEGRATEDPQLELVRFLDFDEASGVARDADAETLVETLERSRFTFAQ